MKWNLRTGVAGLAAAMILSLADGCGTGNDRSMATSGTTVALDRTALVIDVRSPGEYAAGHIPGSTNIPVNQLEQRIAAVSPDKSAPLIVHCQSGSRSASATRILQQQGYQHVTDLGSYANARAKLAN